MNSGYHRPIDRIVINLSPADLPKEAPSSDLPIAIGMLAASGQVLTSGLRTMQLSASCHSTGRCVHQGSTFDWRCRLATTAAKGCWFQSRTLAKQLLLKKSRSSPWNSG